MRRRRGIAAGEEDDEREEEEEESSDDDEGEDGEAIRRARRALGRGSVVIANWGGRGRRRGGIRGGFDEERRGRRESVLEREEDGRGIKIVDRRGVVKGQSS